MTSGFLYTFHAQYTRISVRQLGDKFANLVFHAPTHHQTQLGSILGDLVAAHLDPDLELEWVAWKSDLSSFGVTESFAILDQSERSNSNFQSLC